MKPTHFIEPSVRLLINNTPSRVSHVVKRGISLRGTYVEVVIDKWRRARTVLLYDADYRKTWRFDGIDPILVHGAHPQLVILVCFVLLVGLWLQTEECISLECFLRNVALKMERIVLFAMRKYLA